jgi:endonuclease/exonuclease/phosphatase family metal-dependent hydrolase
VPIIPSVATEFVDVEDVCLQWKWSRIHPSDLLTEFCISDSKVYTPVEGDTGFILRVCVTACSHAPSTYSAEFRVGDSACFQLSNPSARTSNSSKSDGKKAYKSKQAQKAGVPSATQSSETQEENSVAEFYPHLVSVYHLHPLLLSRCDQALSREFSSTGAPFRVCSYNILLDAFCDNEWALANIYPYLLNNRLYANIDIRKQAVLMELLAYRADVICLQEMSKGLFDEFFLPQLARLGYIGEYTNKQSSQPFGCATFVNVTAFRIKQTVCIDLTECWKHGCANEQIRAKLDKFPIVQSHFERTTTTAQCMLLETVQDSSRQLCVVNGHLFSSPQASHFRTLQAALIMNFVYSSFSATTTAETVSGAEASKIPLILCADMNATNDSGVFEYLSTGRLSQDHCEWAEGCVFTDLQTDSQVDRQSNWHNIMTEVDILFARRTFAGFMNQQETKGESAHCHVADLVRWTVIKQAISNALTNSATNDDAIIDKIERQYDYSDEVQLSYADFFGWLAKFKQSNKDYYDLVYACLSRVGQDDPRTSFTFAIDAAAQRNFIGLDLGHHYSDGPFSPACLDTLVTHFAGQTPCASRLDNIFYDAMVFATKLPAGHCEQQRLHQQPLAIPAEVVLGTQGLPSRPFPSDHVSMLVDLYWNSER